MSIMAIVVNFLPWNFVKFADNIAAAEYIEVSSAHNLCMPLLQTLIWSDFQNLFEELMVGLDFFLIANHRDVLGQKRKT